ncbi:PepSY domain-containing protein [Xanthobacter sp. ZOL 2024]
MKHARIAATGRPWAVPPRVRGAMRRAARRAAFGVLLAAMLAGASWLLPSAMPWQVTRAQAGRDCAAPLAEWQPRAALVQQLEAEGWTVQSVRIDDGCYKVRAVNAQGETLRAVFDPVSLERRPGGHHRGGGHHGEDRHRPDLRPDGGPPD